MKSVRIAIFAFAILMVSGIASAQATRTWISGTGDDANPCSRTAPCRTWAGAISKTARNGEMNSLDPNGAGPLTITKSITVDGSHQLSGVLASGGFNAYIVNVTDFVNDPNATVIIRGLDINGAGTGLNGIRILSAKNVIIEDCKIYGFRAAGGGHGIDIVSPVAGMNVTIRNSTISNNGTMGIRVTSTGAGSTNLTVENSLISENGSHAIDLIQNANLVVANSRLIANAGGGVISEAASTNANIMMSAIAFNSVGATALNGSQVRLLASAVWKNGTSVSGNVSSHQNNSVVDNGVNTLPTGIGQQ